MGRLENYQNANEPVDLIPVPSGLSTYLLLNPLRGQEECRNPAGIGHWGRQKRERALDSDRAKAQPKENEMDTEVKTYKVESPETGNVYVVVCSAAGNLKDLMAQLKSCSNCTVSEVPRDRIPDLKALRTIYEAMEQK
jgi:hypothetical protein